MPAMDRSITKKYLTTLILVGIVVWGLFIAGYVWLVSYVAVSGEGGGGLFLAYAPFWILPYLIVCSVYVGFLSARFATGRWKHAWFWGLAGFALTLLFILGGPGLLSPVYPYQSPEIFAGPAIFAFMAPILSALLIMLLISSRVKVVV